MKTLVEQLNESLQVFEVDKWAYLICPDEEYVKFNTYNHVLSADTDYRKNTSYCVLVNTSDNIWESKGSQKVHNAFKRKYGIDFPSFTPILNSNGSIEGSKIIAKIYRKIDSGKRTMKDLEAAMAKIDNPMEDSLIYAKNLDVIFNYFK